MEISLPSKALLNANVRAAGGTRRLAMPRFLMHSRSSTQRAAVERYISQRFASAHRARIDHFLPQLISLGAGDRYFASVGLASAADGALFAEAYLTRPIEQIITQLAGSNVPRSEVLEIGNLVSTWKGSGLLLFVLLSELVDRLGYRWVVFTATPQVQRLLGKLHYAPVAIADADPARLADRGDSWGDYYASAPKVMVGEVRPAVAAARQQMLYRAVAAMLGDAVDTLCRAHRSPPDERSAARCAPAL